MQRHTFAKIDLGPFINYIDKQGWGGLPNVKNTTTLAEVGKSSTKGRVVSILQKLRYPKDQVMWSNTMLWDMFIPIFKLLTLKLSNHWIAQFYEVISLNFRLIKYSDAWKLTFFSLKISWNDFKVKYAWIEVKTCLQA